jgi:hypothetical protein
MYIQHHAVDQQQQQLAQPALQFFLALCGASLPLLPHPWHCSVFLAMYAYQSTQVIIIVCSLRSKC